MVDEEDDMRVGDVDVIGVGTGRAAQGVPQLVLASESRVIVVLAASPSRS